MLTPDQGIDPLPHEVTVRAERSGGGIELTATVRIHTRADAANFRHGGGHTVGPATTPRNRRHPGGERKGTVMESSGVPIEAVETESPALDEPALAADDIVHECGLGSFPASDPPSWWAAGSDQ
jgi:hypothetical protein